MQPSELSRIDLGDLRAQLVKRIGPEKSKRYFFYLNKLLSQKLGKKEFDKLCLRVLGSENLALHNRFILSILKNACQVKVPPPVVSSNAAKLGAQGVNSDPCREDGHEESGSCFPNQNPNVPVWSNGVVPLSPRKGRSTIRERKLRDRPSPLGPNGKVDTLSQLSTGSEDGGNKIMMENGDANPFDYQRSMQYIQPVAELPIRDGAVRRPTGKPNMLTKDPANLSVVEDGEEAERSNRSSFSRSSLVAPLGIPFCSASVGGARKATTPMGSNSDFGRYYDDGVLSDTETLRNRMGQIAVAQGVGGVSTESANVLNNMLDVYLKRLIKSCVELVGSRSTTTESRDKAAPKQQIQGKVINGMWPTNHPHMQGSNGFLDVPQEQRPQHSISLLDFKVAMELNPQQLGEEWPLLLEKICMQSFGG